MRKFTLFIVGLLCIGVHAQNTVYTLSDWNIEETELQLNESDYKLNYNHPLPYADMQKEWTVSAELMCGTLGTEQVFVCKEGTPLITDDMTPDSHRPNADIDPTVMIDDDGTPWIAWGNGDCYMAKLKPNMIELDSEVKKVPMRNFSEGPWLFKRKKLYYMVYAADAPGVQPEQMAYSTAENIEGPWTYRGFISTSANHGFTIHPSVIEFKGKWYYIYHDGSYNLNGAPGGDCRRRVCAEYLYFNSDGTIRFIPLTQEGLSK